MARNGDRPHGPNQAKQAEILAKFDEAISGMSPGELTDLLQDLGALAAPEPEFVDEKPPPPQRRPRRADVVTYRVRVDLTGTKPPLWRRLELASDLYLDAVHEVLQAAFGWTDSHLHRFGRGPQHHSRDTEFYLCPFEVDDGETGVPEEDVRLDEVLVEAGDKVFYTYDYGDDWEHTIKLESVRPRDDSAPRATCTGGRRDGPPEDCGGVPGYELVAAATDPAHPQHAEAVAVFARTYGDDITPANLPPTPFDVEEINDVLGDLGAVAPTSGTSAGGDPTSAAGRTADIGAAGPGLPGADGPAADVPEPLAELVQAVRVPTERRRLLRLIADACLHEPVRVDADTAARMVHPYTWLLDRVGTDGIKLTAAGYLPPVHVEAAMNELDMWDEWVGKGNREEQTLPVLEFRESAQQAGLLRKYRGRLLVTPRGRAARTDPLALWWHLAERTPFTSKDTCDRQAGLLLLLAIAADTADDPNATVARFLDAIGWMYTDGTRLTDSYFQEARETRTVLWRLGALTNKQAIRGPVRPTPDGVSFARAALRTWPG